MQLLSAFLSLQPKLYALVSPLITCRSHLVNKKNYRGDPPELGIGERYEHYQCTITISQPKLRTQLTVSYYNVIAQLYLPGSLFYL